MYLGYKWMEQLTILASRITLKEGKECKLWFGDTAEVKGNYVQGCIYSNGKKSELEQYREMTKDLTCIFINEKYNDSTTESEVHFIIAANGATVQLWYDMMWEGSVAKKMIRKYGDRIFASLGKAEYERIKTETELQTKKYFVNK